MDKLNSPAKLNMKRSTVEEMMKCPQQIQAPMTDYSIIRGKNVLVSPTEEQFELLKKRLVERISDSRGETIYEIGIGEGNCKIKLNNRIMYIVLLFRQMEAIVDLILTSMQPRLQLYSQ